MAIAVDASTPVRWGADILNTQSTTSASFTAPTDALLVLCVCEDGDNAGSPFGTTTVSDSGGLTWTERVRRGEAEGVDGGTAIIYTARTTSSAARTVSVARSSGSGTAEQVSAKVYVLTGVDVDGTPVDTVGASNEGHSTTNQISSSSITPGANGLLFVCDCDWSQSGVFTSSDLTIDTADYAGDISAMSGYKTTTSGVGVTGDLNAGGSGAVQHKWCQITVREAAAAGANPKGPLGNPFDGPFGGPI